MKAVAPYQSAGRVKLIAPNEQIASGVKAVATGHTPGHSSYLFESKGQKLLVMGDADEVVAPQAVFDWAAGLPGNARMIRMAGAGHFFHGRLVELREQLEAALPA